MTITTLIMPSKQEQVVLLLLRGRTLKRTELHALLDQEGLKISRQSFYSLLRNLERKVLIQPQAFCSYRQTPLGVAISDFILEWGDETNPQVLKYSRIG